MNGFYCIQLLFFIFTLQIKCEEKVVESKNPLPYFRRLVEEITDDLTAQNSTTTDSHSYLVSFLIENVKQIYNELDDIEQSEMTTPITSPHTVKPITSTVFVDAIPSVSDILTEVTSPDKNVVINSNTTARRKKETSLEAKFKGLKLDKLNFTSRKPYLNELLGYTTFGTLNNFDDVEVSSKSYELTEKEELMHLSKNLIIFETDRRQRDNNDNYYAHNASYFPSGNDISLRSCIFCNNVLHENCNDPKNRLIPSTVCERDDDVCYSQHTPFGVIDRGCYNVNHNLTTFVCSCNLCNYISISEMPYVFSTKQDWVDNVVELSRTRHLRKSVFKDMSCLKCESNASAKSGDMLDTANCLEGNIGLLPVEECEENEVCGVKAIKHDGYLWRGCVKEPLFNYWWAYCDSDLCNYDIVSSIYDVE